MTTINALMESLWPGPLPAPSVRTIDEMCCVLADSTCTADGPMTLELWFDKFHCLHLYQRDLWISRIPYPSLPFHLIIHRPLIEPVLTIKPRRDEVRHHECLVG